MVASAFGAVGTTGTTQQRYDQRYTITKPKRSTGTTIAIASTDPRNPQNGQPKRITNFDLTFPADSRIDSRAAAQCRADENDFAEAGNPDDACPRGSRLGAGRAAMRSPFSGQDDYRGTVYAYNADKGMIFFVDFPTANASVVIRPRWRGRRLLMRVPQTCIPPASPANGCQGPFGRQEIILVQFSVDIRARIHGRGDNRRILLRTPRTCPSGGWTFESNFKYADGTSLKLKEKSRCSSA